VVLTTIPEQQPHQLTTGVFLNRGVYAHEIIPSKQNRLHQLQRLFRRPVGIAESDNKPNSSSAPGTFLDRR
jgi:hypothetical protein